MLHIPNNFNPSRINKSTTQGYQVSPVRTRFQNINYSPVNRSRSGSSNQNSKPTLAGNIFVVQNSNPNNGFVNFAGQQQRVIVQQKSRGNLLSDRDQPNLNPPSKDTQNNQKQAINNQLPGNNNVANNTEINNNPFRSLTNQIS